MSALESGSAAHAPPAAHAANGPLPTAPAGDTPSRRRRSHLGSFLVVVFVAAVAGGAAYTYNFGLARVRQDGGRLAGIPSELRPNQGRAGFPGVQAE